MSQIYISRQLTNKNMQTNNKLKEFEALVTQHHKLVLGFTLALVRDVHTAEDITQDAFVTAFLKFDKFDRALDFGKWVRGIARMKYLEHGRRRQNVLLEDNLIDLLASQYASWEQQEKQQKQSIYINLKTCITKLDEMSEKIIRKFYFEKQKCAEIAQQCNLNESTVRKRLERIRKNLKTCMEDGGLNNE
jgi:RNA polymerase sigma-70 factor, ECF subfamily